MFESANLDHRIAKDAFQREASNLHEALLNAQYAIKAVDTGRSQQQVLRAY